MAVGALRIELHVPEAQSLKDRRAVLLHLKATLRNRFKIAQGNPRPLGRAGCAPGAILASP